MKKLLSPHRRLRFITEFLGWGNPRDAKVVFIAYEPGGGFWTKTEERMTLLPKTMSADRRLRFYNGRRDHLVHGEDLHRELQMTRAEYEADIRRQRLNITNRIQCYTTCKYLQTYFPEECDDLPMGRTGVITPDHLQQYFVECFLYRHELALNLYPINKSKKEDDYETNVKRYFGFSAKDSKETIQERIRNLGRVECLRRLVNSIEKNKPLYIFAGGNLDEQREVSSRVFDLDYGRLRKEDRTRFGETTYKHTRVLRCSEDYRVWFTQHPNFWLTAPVVDFIINKAGG